MMVGCTLEKIVLQNLLDLPVDFSQIFQEFRAAVTRREMVAVPPKFRRCAEEIE